MKGLKVKQVYRVCNTLILLLIPTLLPLSTQSADQHAIYQMGIAIRALLGILMILNGAWHLCTDYAASPASFIRSKWIWWLLVILGIAVLITALMGYGFNSFGK